MNKIKFSKMQSLGNDFIVIYETAAISEIFNFKESQIRKMADRKKGIGADQILLVKKLDNSEKSFNIKSSTQMVEKLSSAETERDVLKNFYLIKVFGKKQFDIGSQ